MSSLSRSVNLCMRRYKRAATLHCYGRFIVKIFKASLLFGLMIAAVMNVVLYTQTDRALRETPQSADGYKDNLIDGIRANDQSQNLQQTQDNPKSIEIEVKSGRKEAQVKVDGAIIYDIADNARGIHVVVLNQANGFLMASRQFDMYSSPAEDEAMLLFLNKMIMPGRILLFTIMEEGSTNLNEKTKHFLANRYGSRKSIDLGWRDMWAMICHNRPDSVLNEVHSKNTAFEKWAEDVSAKATVMLDPLGEERCKWPDDLIGRKRKQFCNKYDGYGDVCNCTNPSPITFNPRQLESHNLDNIPVTVIAGNRPNYLFRALRTLLQADGADPSRITVFIDGYFEGPLEVTRLFGLRSYQHTPLGIKNGRISQHYKASLSGTFNLYPNAKYTIIIEEDLDVAPDFFSYFSQTLPLLEKDPSLYCVSAWNDQGYEHSSNDPTLLYRVETMPGLGWMLKRSIYKVELEHKWPTPGKFSDWDMWMRGQLQRKERECIIPDISRTYHFGKHGVNMDPFFHDVLFKNKTINKIPGVKLKDIDRMKRDNYEVLVNELILTATVMNTEQSPCNKSFIPVTQNGVYVLYIRMVNPSDKTTFLGLAKCIHIWDLDVRGFHKSMWRMFLGTNQFIIVGVPASPYAKHKPENVVPMYIPPPPKEEEQ